MISITRSTMKLCVAAAALAAALPAAPSHAETFAYVSATGSGTACTAAQPCATFSAAFGVSNSSLRILCLNGAAEDSSEEQINASYNNGTLDIDCPLGFVPTLAFSPLVTNATVRLRHLGFRNNGFSPDQIVFQGSGTLILEDCVFSDTSGTALNIEPNGPLKLVIRNSRISNNGAGILLKPASGGSINATLDHVVIAGNGGGGIKTDSTNGTIDLDVSYSEISNNAGNGINAVAGSSQNIVSVKNSVIARNGAAGVQVNGGNAGVLVATTLLDQNTAGATSIVSGGNMFSYGNNDVVGALGSGFPSTAPLH
jgi:Right handed beta helix region